MVDKVIAELDIPALRTRWAEAHRIAFFGSDVREVIGVVLALLDRLERAERERDEARKWKASAEFQKDQRVRAESAESALAASRAEVADLKTERTATWAAYRDLLTNIRAMPEAAWPVGAVKVIRAGADLALRALAEKGGVK